MFPNQRGATTDLRRFSGSEYGGSDRLDLSFLGVLNFRYDSSLLDMGVLNDLIDLHEPAPGNNQISKAMEKAVKDPGYVARCRQQLNQPVFIDAQTVK